LGGYVARMERKRHPGAVCLRAPKVSDFALAQSGLRLLCMLVPYLVSLIAVAAYLPVPHPVGFVYLLAVAACVALGLILLAAALLLAIWPPSRPIGRRIAGGVVGSFPFLFFFQGLSLPVLVAIGTIPFLLGIWSGPADMPNMIAALGELGLMLGVFVAASVTGLITGWGVGARVASDMPVRDALRASKALSFLSASLNRFLPVRMRIAPEGGLAVGLGIIVLTAGGLAVGHMAYVEAYGSAEMDYRGEKIRLAKKYVDYDDYKNDPGNLAASEIPRVEKMMTEARIGPDFASWKDFVDQSSAISFPGYGSGGGPKVVATAREFVVEVIEIPRVAKERYFVLEKMSGGTLRLVDDFVARRSNRSLFWAIESIRLVEDKLVYSDRESKIVRETSVAR
jgi:hypothetical protein